MAMKVVDYSKKRQDVCPMAIDPSYMLFRLSDEKDSN